MTTLHTWRFGGDRSLALDAPRLMGILNLTPDSFSDGGRYRSVDEQLVRTREMIADGADMIDVGGESTRPGAMRIPVQEQIDRTSPFIEAMRGESDVPISIDTTRGAVARAALDAGADAVNDVSAGREDGGMVDLVAERGCGLVLMHRRVPPDRDAYSHAYETPPAYDDVVGDVAEFLRERAVAAEGRGVSRAAIVVDPGIGFGKTVEQNWALVARTAELTGLGYPVLGATSRKSFIGAVTGEDAPERRLAGTLVASMLQHRGGIRLFRVHDVRAHRAALRALEAAVG